MEAILDWGVSLLVFIQSLGVWLEAPMKAITFLGNEEFYLLVAPAIYWCLDTVMGLRLALILMVSGSINTTFKFLFQQPRPYWYSPQVQAMSSETSFGLPSGHAQNAVAVWGGIAGSLKQRWAWIAGGLLAFLIGFSRMYLGVHFPSDVLLGWLLGALLLWFYLRWEPVLLKRILAVSVARQLLVAFTFSVGLVVLSLFVRSLFAGWVLPLTWVSAAEAAYPLGEPIEPLALSGMFSNVGALFGLAAGAIGMRQLGGFEVGGPAWSRILRYVLGLIGVLVLWRGLGMFLPGGEDLAGYIFRYLRYALIGVWITGFGPWVFIRLKLASYRK